MEDLRRHAFEHVLVSISSRRTTRFMHRAALGRRCSLPCAQFGRAEFVTVNTCPRHLDWLACRGHSARPRSPEGWSRLPPGCPRPPAPGPAHATWHSSRWPPGAAHRPRRPPQRLGAVGVAHTHAAAPGHGQRLLGAPRNCLSLLLRHQRHDAHRQVVRLGAGQLLRTGRRCPAGCAGRRRFATAGQAWRRRALPGGLRGAEPAQLGPVRGCVRSHNLTTDTKHRKRWARPGTRLERGCRTTPAIDVAQTRHWRRRVLARSTIDVG